MNSLPLHKQFGFALFIAWMSCAWPVHAAKPPTPFTASYKVEKYNSTVAVMQLTLQQKDDQFIYTSKTQPKGLLDLFSNDKIVEQSTLRWDAEHQRLQLLGYQYTREERARDNQQFTVQWNNENSATCSGMARKQSFTLELASPAWDQLSVQLALMADLSSDENPAADYRYSIIDDAKLSEYLFQPEAQETIKIGQQEYHTLKLKRAHESGKRTTHMWLAPELGFVPVRVEQYKKGELNFSMELAAPVKVTP